MFISLWLCTCQKTCQETLAVTKKVQSCLQRWKPPGRQQPKFLLFSRSSVCLRSDCSSSSHPRRELIAVQICFTPSKSFAFSVARSSKGERSDRNPLAHNTSSARNEAPAKANGPLLSVLCSSAPQRKQSHVWEHL